MSSTDVFGAIREQIRFHEAEIAKLNRMLNAAGADASSGNLRKVLLHLVLGGPKTAKELIDASQAKANTVYVQLSRMRKAKEIYTAHGKHHYGQPPEHRQELPGDANEQVD